MTSESEAPAFFEGVPEPLAEALVARGFTELTAVQKAVLDASLDGKDLRLASQTGSGKTVAVGLVIGKARLAAGASGAPREKGVAKPSTLVVAPTRELANQVGTELAWLFEGIPLRVAVVTGGTPLPGDFRALRANPDVLVGTPGRLVDHLDRGTIDLADAREVVLDEADEMLDLGFRDELESILKRVREERVLHLVSATFADEVLSLADRYQRDALLVRGTQAGRPNEDITHVVHIVRPDERVAATINLLLAEGEARALVFVKTRVDATGVGEALAAEGFPARALSGEMSQRERTATLDAFRAGTIRVLVATDVAARGLDVQGVSLVVHFDLPGSGETLTHRSGRTGRAGAKGTSVMLVPPAAKNKAERLLRQAGIYADLRPMPTPAQIESAMEHRAVHALATATLAEADAPRLERLARTLLEARDPATLVAVLLARSGIDGPCAPKPITRLDGGRKDRPQAPVRSQGGDSGPERPYRDAGPARAEQGYVAFQVSWGGAHGADARRLLAVVCRRGNVTREDVGAIRVGDKSSVVEIVADRAGDFAANAMQPDLRDPRVRFRPFETQPPRGGSRPGGRPPMRRKPPGPPR